MMKLTRKEKALVKAYENYRKSIVAFCKESGMNVEMRQVIRSTDEETDHRNLIVSELKKIDEKYNG